MSNRKVDEKTALGGWLVSGARRSPGSIQFKPVENMAAKSMPDREGYIEGLGQFWVELKAARRPSRLSTPVRFVFQEGQSSWLRKRWKMGGSAWLLCQVGSSWHARRYLLKGADAGIIEEGVQEQWMVDHCVISPLAEAWDMLCHMATGQTHIEESQGTSSFLD